MKKHGFGKVTFGIIVLPFVLGLLNKWKVLDFFGIPFVNLLTYYGTTLGVFTTIYTYLDRKWKDEKEKEEKDKPKLFVEVKRNIADMDVYDITIENLNNALMSCVYLYDCYVKQVLGEKETFHVAFGKKSEIVRDAFSVDGSINIIEKDGLPKYVQVMFEDKKGNYWEYNFDKIKNGEQKYYQLSEINLH